jgi:hypothetical protein
MWNVRNAVTAARLCVAVADVGRTVHQPAPNNFTGAGIKANGRRSYR